MCRVSARKRSTRCAGVARVDVGAPALERGGAFGARHVAVGNVVDSAAEGVDLIHRVALRGRQDAHREIKRAAGRGGSGVDFWFVHDKIGNSQDDLRWRRPLKGVQEVLMPTAQRRRPARADTRETPGWDAGNGEKYNNVCEMPQFWGVNRAGYGCFVRQGRFVVAVEEECGTGGIERVDSWSVSRLGRGKPRGDCNPVPRARNPGPPGPERRPMAGSPPPGLRHAGFEPGRLRLRSLQPDAGCRIPSPRIVVPADLLP